MVSCFSNEAIQIGADVLLLLEVPVVAYRYKKCIAIVMACKVYSDYCSCAFVKNKV